MIINKETGFTLIELMISLVIFSIVMAAAYGVYISSTRTANIQNASAGAQQNVRVGIELMTQDIRMAGFDPLGTAGSSIEMATPTKIRITSDRNQNGAINESDFERVSYELSGTNLRRILYEGANQNVQPLLENVTELAFVYSGINNSNVNIRLAVREPAGMGGDVTRTLETRVICRNLVD